MRRGPGIALFVSLQLLLLTGCNVTLTRSSEIVTEAPATPSKVGSGVTMPTASPTPAATRASAPVSAPGGATNQGTLRLTLFDERGFHPGGVPVEFVARSGARQRVTSGSGGALSFVAEPGDYAAGVVAGCHGMRHVLDGGRAQFRLIGNRETTGQLIVRWERYVAPVHPVSASKAGNWPRNEPVTVTFTLDDRCRDGRARNASFSTYAYETSPNLTVAGTPSYKSDGEGSGKVTVRCVKAGEIKLVIRDRESPKDTLDLAAAAGGLGGVPRCS